MTYKVCTSLCNDMVDVGGHPHRFFHGLVVSPGDVFHSHKKSSVSASKTFCRSLFMILVSVPYNRIVTVGIQGGCNSSEFVVWD